MRVSNIDIDRIYINSCIRTSSFKFHKPDSHLHLYYELFYVKQGSCRFFINNAFYDLAGGDFLLVPPKEPHYTKYLSDIPCTRINIYFKHEDLFGDDRGFTKDFEERYLKNGVFHVPSVYQRRIYEIMLQMLSEEKIEDSRSSELLRLHLRELFLYCDRFCTFTNANLAKIETEDEQILSAARYIAENFSDSLTLDSLAEIAGLSATYFSKKFKATTGFGVKEYISFVRLRHAAMELLSTRRSITEIAMGCGFSDSGYFKDAFKKLNGLSPREFRKAHNLSIQDETL